MNIEGQLVTCWYHDVGEGLEFNHLSNGFHLDHEAPAYRTLEQRQAWSQGIWVPRLALLTNGVVHSESGEPRR